MRLAAIMKLELASGPLPFPSARLHAPSGLVKERPDLRIDRVIGAVPEPAFAGTLEELPIEGFRLEETVLIHLPARTLVVADLVYNVGAEPHDSLDRLFRSRGRAT